MLTIAAVQLAPADLEIARRLAHQTPNTIIEVYEERSHFDPPHVAEANRFAAAVQQNWERARAAS